MLICQSRINMKNKWIFVLIALVSLLSIIVFITGNGKSTFSKKESIEALKTGTRFDKISIESKNENFTIQQIQNKWLIDGTTEANLSKIKAMVAALENIQMKFPASHEQSVKLRDTILKNGTTVSLTFENKPIYRLHFIDFNYHTAALSPKDYPVFIEIRTFSDLPLGALISKNKPAWSNNLLIDLAKEEIATVRIDYFSNPGESFSIDLTGSTTRLFSVEGAGLENFNDENIADYLNFFSGICFETRDNKKYYEDFRTKNFILEIVAKSGRKIKLEAYNLYNPETSVKDINTFAAIVNNSDTIHLNYSEIDPILVPKSYFLKK